MTSLTRKKNDLAARLAKDGPRKMLAIDGGEVAGSSHSKFWSALNRF